MVGRRAQSPVATAWIPESGFPVIFCGKSTGVCLRVNPPIWTTYPGPLEESAETSTEEGRCCWLLGTGSPHDCGRLQRKTPCLCREAWRSPGGLSFV